MSYRIALWGAWYGSHNVGDQAMLLTIAKMLRDSLGDVQFTVFTDNAAHVRDYGPREVGCRVRALQNRSQFPMLVRTLATSDLFIVGGGVPFYEQPYHLCVMVTLVGLARLFRTPYMTWAVASQRIHSTLAKRIFRWVANGAREVTCRDPRTAEMFRSCGVTREVLWSADPVFCLEPCHTGRVNAILARAGRRELGRPLAALACREMRHDHRYSQEHHNQKSPSTIRTMIASFAAMLDRLWEAGYQPILIPMNTVAPDDDRLMSRRIRARARWGDRALLVDEELRPQAVPAILRECCCCVTSRLHAAVLAMVANCPPLMYSIGPKSEGIMRTMMLGDWVVHDESTSPAKAVALLDRLLSSETELRRCMVTRLEELRHCARIPARLAAQILAVRRGSGSSGNEMRVEACH